MNKNPTPDSTSGLDSSERLVAALGHSLRGGDPGRFAVRDHWIARLLDVVDLLRTAWSKLY